MRYYLVNVEYNCKGDRYPLTERIRVEGSSAGTAAQRALRIAKKRKPSAFKEKVGSMIHLTIEVGSPLRGTKEETDVETVLQDTE